MAKRVVLLLALGLWSAWTVAADATDPYDSYRSDELDYDESLEVPWVELETRVQKLPEDADLTRLALDRLPPNLSLYADLQNLTVSDKDLVSRTWLVVRSAQGAYNGTFEAIRCATGEYKIYAYGNPQRSKPLRVVNLPRWRKIRPNSYRDELAKDYICDGTRPKTPHQVRSTRAKSAADYDSPYDE